MAAARFVASCVVETRELTDQYGKFVPVLSPSEPPARVMPVQLKPTRVAVVPMLLPPVPGVTAVTVTIVPRDEAVTFAPTQALIAFLRFVASTVVSVFVANVAVGNVGHVFVPSVPLFGAAQVKMLVLFVAEAEMVLPAVPSVLEVIVTVLVPPEPAVTPAAAAHALMAAAKFVANVVVLELVANVPVVDPVHPFEPAAPPLTAPHEKTPVLLVVPTARNGPGLV